ncbi:MAG: hypothetical protein Q9214_008090, partial [Letrouitia sp. 1 TL-2023]
MDILNVERNQEVEVKVEQHDEKYKAPKKKYKPFSGGGQRLGSPVPSATAETTSAPSAAAAAAASGEAPKAVEVDESQPTLSLQIRLGDGSRLVQRFNATHTIGDVYTFVMASNPASQSRSFVLMTTFPSKELSDQGQVLDDLADFKRGGVVVQ